MSQLRLAQVNPLLFHIPMKFNAFAGGDSIIYLWDFRVAKCLCGSQKVCEAPIRKLRPIQVIYRLIH
jgi:hypothetical protein